MSKTTLILVAASMVCGGTRAKDGAVTPFEVGPGAELTEAVLAKLGLDAEAVTELIAKGAIAEVDVRAAEAETADDSELVVKLTAATKRADAAEAACVVAEAKVKELEGKLAGAAGAVTGSRAGER